MTLDPLSIRKGDKFTVEYTASENARPSACTTGVAVVPIGQSNIHFGDNYGPKTLTSITRAPRPIRPGDRIRRKDSTQNDPGYRCAAISGEFILYTIQYGPDCIEPYGDRLDRFERTDD